MKKLPEPFINELGVHFEESIVCCFNTLPKAFRFTPEEMQKCLEMLYVYGYKF